MLLKMENKELKEVVEKTDKTVTTINKNKKVKYVLNMVIMFIVIFVILYFTLKDNFNAVMDNIKKMNIFYLLIGIGLMILYRFFLGISLYIVTKCNKQRYSLKKSFQLNFITQFFNGITPFATGGQPSQIYYLHQEGIPIAKGTNIVLQNFILYQTALIILGLFAVIFNKITGLFAKDNIMANLVTLGFVINFLVWLGSFIISFGEKINSFIINKLLVFFAKLKLIKNYEKTKKKFTDYITNFYENAMILKESKKDVFIAVIVNIMALLFLYSVPIILIRGMGIASNINYLTSLVAVSYVMLIGSFVPIPGGTGGIEYGFIHFYGYFLSDAILVSVMIVWRVITYYIGMVFGGILIPLYKKGSD